MPISSASAVGSGGIAAATGGKPPELSASSIVAKTAAGSHTLTIDGFSRSKSMRFRSSTFTAGGHTWCIDLIRNSCRAGPLPGGGTLMLPKLCCTHCPAGEEILASWSYSLLDQNGQPSYTESVGDVCKFSKRMGIATPLVTTKFIETHAATYLPGDCLKIRCDVTVYMAPRCEDRVVPSCQVPVLPPDIGQQMGRLLSSGVGADLTFEVAGGETFAVHRHILNVRSPVLLEEIISAAGVMEKKTEATATSCGIHICGMEAVVVKALLHYIYTDSLPEKDEGDMMMDMVRQLIAAANRYSLDKLKLFCEDMLCRRVDTSSVAARLALAEEYNCHGLKKACFRFLMSGSNLKAAMAAGGFEHLRSSCPSVLRELLAMVDRH